MIVFLYNFSSSNAWVFIEIFIILPADPNKKRQIASCQTVSENPIPIKRQPKMNDAAITTFLLPNFAARYPEKGRVMNEPTGMVNKTAPNLASERLSLC